MLKRRISPGRGCPLALSGAAVILYIQQPEKPSTSAQPHAAPILKRFRAALNDLHGERIGRGMLARGDAHKDSDYDVTVFLKDLADRWPELDRLADLSTDLLDETGEFIHAMPYRGGSYNERTSLMREIRREGVDL